MLLLSILITIGTCGPFSLKIPNIRFHEHSSDESHYALYADRHDEANSHLLQLLCTQA